VTGRRGRRCKQLMDVHNERRGHYKLKRKATDRTVWRTGFGRGCGRVVRYTAEEMYSIKWLVSTKGTECVYCAVRTESWYSSSKFSPLKRPNNLSPLFSSRENVMQIPTQIFSPDFITVGRIQVVSIKVNGMAVTEYTISAFRGWKYSANHF
jgi:hypothetical protein